MLFDVVIVGGSYAGMAAALQLARARRSVLVLDSGARRNRFAEASHGFLGQDGRSPAVIAEEAKAQLLKYGSVTWADALAERALKADTTFAIETNAGAEYEAKRLILATGVADILPEIPGLKERWGMSVFHCPYCHGYELYNGRLGVLATSPHAMHQAMLVPEWGKTTLFTNGAMTIEQAQAEELAARGVVIEDEPVAEVSRRAEVRLRSGRTISLDAIFTQPRTELASPLAEQLGCAIAAGPLGHFIQTDTTKATTVPGIFACGDAAMATGSISLAVGDGAMAGVAAHRSLIF